MNTNKGFAAFLSRLEKKQNMLVLLICAFVFALPFMTKSIAAEVPFFNVTGIFGWCGLVPLFMTVFDPKKTLKRVLCSLFCFFFAFYFFVYSWFINLYPLDFAGLGRLESVGVIIIAETVIPFLHGAVMTLCVFLGFAAAKNVRNLFVKSLLLSAGYVLGEYMQSVGTFAFPWARLFVGQTGSVALLQSASLFGSYFITLIMVLVNALLALSFLDAQKDKKKSRIFAITAVGIFAFNLLFGIVRINTVDTSDFERLDATILQGNIPSGEKWSGEASERKIYLDLAVSVKKNEADIVVMPETAFPVTINPDDASVSAHEDALMKISKTFDATLFAGTFSRDGEKSYNSIFAVNPDGSFSQPYNKYNIVPFGEFLPYRSIIEKITPSLADMNMFTSDISRGESFVPIETDEGKAACLVCFDSIFPETARQQVENGADFIVIATNDSWYKTSSALYQHADHAVMRAIENNVPVIRSANTGISRIIDSFGRVICQTKVNERVAVSASVLLPQTKTLYTKTGELVVPLCALAVFAFLACGIIKKKASR